MSSTRTWRSWRVTFRWPALSLSSSNTVGVVRTGMPRSRHAATTRARSVPGAEGIAMTTSSGSTSSRIRARSSESVVPSTFSPCSSFIPCLRGSSSTNPTGRSRSCGLRISSRTTRRPPSPPPTISTSRAPLAARKLRTRPSTTRWTRKRAPIRKASASRKNSAITLPGRVTGGGLEPDRRRDRVQEGDRAHDHERGHDQALDHRLVVALAHERPQPLVLAEQRQRHERDRHDPVDGVGEQVAVAF